jgi:hypothetical protein
MGREVPVIKIPIGGLRDKPQGLYSFGKLLFPKKQLFLTTQIMGNQTFAPQICSPVNIISFPKM